MSLDTFLNDESAKDTAFRCNHDIGEAVRQMTATYSAYRDRITEWQGIIGSRNAMSHSLFDRDWELLWHNLKDGVPRLAAEVTVLTAEITER